MPRGVAPASRERLVGMEAFFTDTPPLGGRLRSRAQDFVVKELGAGPTAREHGRFLATQVELVNWEHNHFVRDAARALRIPRRNVGFSGTKDKRAVTTQWFTFLVRQDDEAVVDTLQRMDRVRVLAHRRVERSLRLGQHDGNRFTVKIREVSHAPGAAREILDGTLRALDALGGFPNFFGMQRFGAVRPITHLVGEALLNGDLEGAVMTYVTGPALGESPELADARSRIREDRDWRRAAAILPREAKFELAVAHHLAGHPDDHLGALRRLPANLLLLFVHAYQSFLYNRVLSARIEAGLPLQEPVEGDIVLPASRFDPLPRRDAVRVTPQRIDLLRRQSAKGRAVVTAPLFGYDTPVAQGEPGEIEARILEGSGIAADAYRLPQLPEAASKGLRRGILTPSWDLRWSVDEDGEVEEDGRADTVATLDFALPRGAYATTLLREVIKAEDSTDY